MTKDSVLEEAHEKRHKAMNDAHIPHHDSKNSSRKAEPVLNSLRYIANNGKEVEAKQKIAGRKKAEHNYEKSDVTRAFVVAIMSMTDSNKMNSFFHLLKCREFEKITIAQKREVLRRIYKEIREANEVPSQKYIEDYYSYLEDLENTDYEELYRNEMIELLDERIGKIDDDLEVAEYREIIQKKIADIVKSGIEDVYTHNIIGGILYPTEYSVESTDDVFGVLQSKEVFTKSELSLLDYDEKKQLMNMLLDKIADCINEWKDMVNKVFEGKIKDSSLLIDEILDDSKQLVEETI